MPAGAPNATAFLQREKLAAEFGVLPDHHFRL
jgi:hypothetical protein